MSSFHNFLDFLDFLRWINLAIVHRLHRAIHIYIYIFQKHPKKIFNLVITIAIRCDKTIHLENDERDMCLLLT